MSIVDTLSRSLTPTRLAFCGVGTIVGAGVYTVRGAAAGLAGPALWASTVLAGIAAFLTALSYPPVLGLAASPTLVVPYEAQVYGVLAAVLALGTLALWLGRGTVRGSSP